MGGQLKSLRLMTLSGTALLVVMSGSSGAHAADETSSVARGGGLVDEIVVSARRREERLQDVPASVASLSAESLEARGVNTTIQLTQVTPGLFMGFTGVFAQPVIRGIGSSSATAGDESNVATYIDGVYVSQMFGTIFKLANIERVEVLKGPQGTLYGRNATGGAISVTTKAPTFDATGDLSLTHGSFNHRQITGYYSAPISGKMAYSIAVIASKNSGYVRNIFDNGRAGVDEIYAVRAKLLFKPTDQLNFVLSVDAGQTDESVMLATTPLNGNTSARTQAPTALIAIRPYEISLNIQPFSRVYQRGVSLRSTLDLGWAELTSITARYTTTDKTDADSDASTALLVHTTTTFPSHTASQEFQLSSPSGSRLQWLVGALAFDSDATTYRLSKPAFTNFFTRVDTRAYAVYGEGTYDLTTALSVTAGLRYSYERKHNVGRLTAASPTVDTTEHWSSVTPRVIAKYEIPQAGNIYASFSRGFKSGQLNSSTLTGIAVAPETVSAYEIGAKTLFNGPLRISVAAFYYDFTDIQVSSRLTTGSGGAQLLNAAAAAIKGAEANFDARLTSGLMVNVGVAYTDATYDNFPQAIVTTPRVLANGQLAGNVQTFGDVSGNRMVRTPKWTANVGLQYSHDFPIGNVQASGNVYHMGGMYWDFANRLKEKPYTLINAKIAVTPHGANYRISVYGENLGDVLYSSYTNTSTVADWYVPAPPRAFGIRLDIKW